MTSSEIDRIGTVAYGDGPPIPHDAPAEAHAQAMSDAFGYTDEQLEELDKVNAKRWALHREWFDEYAEDPYCKRCGANVAASNFDLHIQWHRRRKVRIELDPTAGRQ